MMKFRVYHQTPDVNKFIAWTLINKVLNADKNVIILTPSKALAEALDDYLWKFAKFSFLPHCLAENTNAKLTPVIIASDKTDEKYIENRDMLIIIGEKLPSYLTSFSDIAIVIRGDYNNNEILKDKVKSLTERGHECLNYSVKDSDIFKK